MDIAKLLLGRKLANREADTRKIGTFEGIPAMGLDGLGSSAYGPEAALTILIPLGGASLAYIGWIMAPIIGLLAILFASYWQTIRAYPSNGGAYIVAKENLGTDASLLAAAALMADYVLNVAVGISAGVGALISAVPMLHPYILPLCLGILVVITIVNLRGTLDAGRLFALPTYLFLASFAAILGLGIYHAAGTAGRPQPVMPPASLPEAAGSASFWLLLRAFAAGCTAMTGVEAVSNGMSAFREPPVTHGHRTLTAVVVSLGVLLAGIAYLATAYRIGAMDQTRDGYQSVLSQLAGAVAGNGILYYLAIGSALCVLCLSANTSFVAFPQLCRMVACDGFLPKPFAAAGRRLVFSSGILYLAGASGLLLLVFGGITDHLIPLFAIGAFLTFTLSQVGMVVHWRRKHPAAPGPAHRLHLWVTMIGALATGGALIVIIVAKFTDGAWITVLIIPGTIVLLKTIHGYYETLARQQRSPPALDFSELPRPVVLVAVEQRNRHTDRTLKLAMSLSPDVIALHLTRLVGPEHEEHDRLLMADWKRDVEQPALDAGRPAPRLMILQAQYRAMHEPILKLMDELRERLAGREVILLIPEIVKQHWYQHVLHTHRAHRLRTQLRRRHSHLVVISVPWYLEEGS